MFDIVLSVIPHFTRTSVQTLDIIIYAGIHDASPHLLDEDPKKYKHLLWNTISCIDDWYQQLQKVQMGRTQVLRKTIEHSTTYKRRTP